MGRLYIRELEGRTYDCKTCRTKLALADDITSRIFQCPRGKAFLFHDAVNVCLGANEQKTIMSGQYTIADVYCVGCGRRLGWKYVAVQENSQKFKEGKYVLERSKIVDSEGSELSVDTNPSADNAENPSASNAENEQA